MRREPCDLAVNTGRSVRCEREAQAEGRRVGGGRLGRALEGPCRREEGCLTSAVAEGRERRARGESGTLTDRLHVGGREGVSDDDPSL